MLALLTACFFAASGVHASLDTLTHTSGAPLLEVIDTELSSTSRELLLSTVTTFEHPVVQLRFDIGFATAMDPSTLTVEVETELESQVSCDVDWAVIDGDLRVTLSFATPYELPASAVMTVYITDATAPSMITNAVVSLDGIVVVDNVEGLRLAGSHHADPNHELVPSANTAVLPALSTSSSPVHPRLYPSVAATELRIVDVPAGYQSAMVCAMDGSQVASLQLAGRSDLVLDVHSLPQGRYQVIMWGAAGRSRLSFLKE